VENSLFKQPVIDFIQKGQTVIYRKAFLISLLFANCWLGSHQALGAAQEEIPPEEFIQEQDQIDCYRTLSDLPYEMLIHIAKYLDFDSLKNLIRADSSFYPLLKDQQVRKALKDSEVNGLLSKISTLEPSKLYTAVSLDEIKAASMENRDPEYLAVIHKAYGIRVREFVRKLSVGESREARIRHGLNMFCLMYSSGYAVRSIVFDAARQAARSVIGYAPWYAAVDATGDHAWDAFRSIGREQASRAASQAALFSAREDAWYAARDAASYAAGDTAKNAASYAAGDTAKNAASYAAMEVLSTTQNFSHQERGRISYIAVEITALLHYLKFTLDDPSPQYQGIFQHSYHTNELALIAQGVPKNLLIWESKEAWDAFYAKHFGELKPDALAFLTPFLDEINKTWLSLNPQS
jgi:hypothetical protein